MNTNIRGNAHGGKTAALALEVERAKLQGKVVYVMSQNQTRDHHCHWPNCSVQVPPAMWGCKAHWYKLPARLRHRIWLAYQQGQESAGKYLGDGLYSQGPSKRYIEAAREVQDWIKKNYPNG